ncbi:MAG TPA: uroporphyrinogen decarboxylase family protein [Armatimonadota bacterium]|nr:uroporphyrinogen decarboxylase family protein [Armatimonadota bacterium]
MMPDYSNLRDDSSFGWSVSATQGALREITGTPIREFNLQPEACIHAYREGRPLLREMFGEDVGMPSPATPAVSYGHVNCLGSELLFPEGGEVAHTHIYGSLAEGIQALKQPVDFATTGMAPFYMDFQEQMKAAFPDEPVSLGFGAEGPITTAYELRGEGFFTDIFDDPEGAAEFLRLAVDSIVAYAGWRARANGAEFPNPVGGGMVDDLSSFIPPRKFRELVIPAWERYYSGITTGRRSAHVEDLRAEQLVFLEEIGLWSYDPSVSPRLSPPIIVANCRVPFGWRLVNFHYREMSVQDIEDFVYLSCADRASGVFTHVCDNMCTPERVEQVHAFIAAGKEAKRLVEEEGCSREEMRERVSPGNREGFWDRWCGYLGPHSTRGGAQVA